MTDSVNLITAQVSFVDTHLALIHIDVSLYPLFLQPILQLLFGEDDTEDAINVPWTNRHDFLNISIAPEGISIICTRFLADTLFVPLRDYFQKSAPEVDIVKEDYIVIQVDGQGLDAGQRVLDLSGPLAMAGVSIFFLTTYFSDYILVPVQSRRMVTHALEQRGFVFSRAADAFVSQLSPSLTFSTGSTYHPAFQHQRTTSSPPSSSTAEHFPIPSTPPAKDIPELQRRTFTKLNKSNILPLVDRSLRLVNCAGNDRDDPSNNETLKNDILQVLLATSPTKLRRQFPSTTKTEHTNGHGHRPVHPPTTALGSATDNGAEFLSITLTATEPASIFLETRLIPRLGKTLLGAQGGDSDSENTLVPITFNLQALPMEATGIVCGVAGCLAAGLTGASRELGDEAKPAGDERGTMGDGAIEVTFLSTAKAGTVLVKEGDLERALKALEWARGEVAGKGDVA
jgi:hypothetical protein